MTIKNIKNTKTKTNKTRTIILAAHNWEIKLSNIKTIERQFQDQNEKKIVSVSERKNHEGLLLLLFFVDSADADPTAAHKLQVKSTVKTRWPFLVPLSPHLPPAPAPPLQGQWRPGTRQVHRKLFSFAAQTNVSMHPKFKALTGREPQMVSSIEGQDLLTRGSQQPLPAHKRPQCREALGHPALQGCTVLML